MKEIVIISGKGGTGKTSITASFAVLGGNAVITADCDVDASDMHVFMQPQPYYTEDFYSGQYASIDQDLCINCGKCLDVCRFDAVRVISGRYSIDKMDCEGCGYCTRICPAHAIRNINNHVGWWYISKIKTSSKMVHARMKAGAENSGKLVAKVKNTAREIAETEEKPFVLIDGSPGIGCPVISSLSGADYVILVSEPTVSGLHDLKRVYDLVQKFKIPVGCIINKADINRENRDKIVMFLHENSIDHLTDLPYDLTFTKAMIEGKSIVEYDNNILMKILNDTWKTLIKKLNYPE
jgi:MinD superfamily P-loop ATPase